jgi:hypothetical protein
LTSFLDYGSDNLVDVLGYLILTSFLDYGSDNLVDALDYLVLTSFLDYGSDDLVDALGYLVLTSFLDHGSDNLALGYPILTSLLDYYYLLSRVVYVPGYLILKRHLDSSCLIWMVDCGSESFLDSHGYLIWKSLLVYSYLIVAHLLD